MIASAIPPLRPRPSFTLIEVLVALVLTAFVASAAGSLSGAALSARRSVEQNTTTMRREAFVWDTLQTDLRHLIPALPGSATPIRLFGTPLQVLEIDCLAALGSDDDSLHLRRLPATVRYRLVHRTPAAKRLDLVREVVDRTSPTRDAIRETIARDIVGFEVEVLAGPKWTRLYPDRPQRDPSIRAVRIACRWSDSSAAIPRTFRVGGGDRRPEA